MGIFSEMDLTQRRDNDLPPQEEGRPEAATTAPPFDSESPLTEPEAETPIAPSAQPQASDIEVDDAEAKVEDDEEARRMAHEEAEAKRKAEWEAAQEKKKAAKEEQIQQVTAMTDEDVMAAAIKRISVETERLTRRNMKDCISEYIQTLCLSDITLARTAICPWKSMTHCIWHINKRAREYVQQEMKDNDIWPDRNGIYGSDVPDELCYQWAEEYFRNPDAEEDEDKEDKFEPRPYRGKSSSKSTVKSKKTVAKKTESKKPVPPKKEDSDQIMLGDFGMSGVSA